MPRSPSLQTFTRLAVPRTLVVGFLVAALATLIIAIVNFHSAETCLGTVAAMDHTPQAMRQLSPFHLADKDAETNQRGL